MEIRLLKIAETELDEAVTFYNSEQPELGADLLLNLFTPLSESKPTPKPRTLSLKIPAGVNYDDSPMELSIKYSKAKS